MKKNEREYLEKFNREAESNHPTTDWGRARRQERRYDIFNKASQVNTLEDVESIPILPDNVRQINIQINPRAVNWADLVHDKVDKERGRNMINDIEPGLIRMGKGKYKASFFPDSQMFKTEEAARNWLRNKQAIYARTAR